MEIKAFIDRENSSKSAELDRDATIKDLLASLKINPVTVIVAKNGELVMESEKINENDNIKIFSVISGG